MSIHICCRYCDFIFSNSNQLVFNGDAPCCIDERSCQKRMKENAAYVGYLQNVSNMPHKPSEGQQ